MKTIAAVVNELFDRHRRGDGEEYSNSEVARALNGELSRGYLSKLRAGEIPNPGRNALLALCQYFNEPPSVFFPELKDELAQDEESPPLRTTGLTPEARRYLEGLADLLRQTGADKHKGEKARQESYGDE